MKKQTAQNLPLQLRLGVDSPLEGDEPVGVLKNWEKWKSPTFKTKQYLHNLRTDIQGVIGGGQPRVGHNNTLPKGEEKDQFGSFKG